MLTESTITDLYTLNEEIDTSVISKLNPFGWIAKLGSGVGDIASGLGNLFKSSMESLKDAIPAGTPNTWTETASTYIKDSLDFLQNNGGNLALGTGAVLAGWYLIKKLAGRKNNEKISKEVMDRVNNLAKLPPDKARQELQKIKSGQIQT